MYFYIKNGVYTEVGTRPLKSTKINNLNLFIERFHHPSF